MRWVLKLPAGPPGSYTHAVQMAAAQLMKFL
jgi:hypothetical protein